MNSETEKQESILVVKDHKTLRNHPVPVLKAWVNRFIENGDQVTIKQVDDDILFTCPNRSLEFYVLKLCDVIDEFGFAKTLFPEDTI